MSVYTAEQKEWINSRPLSVRIAIKKWPPTICYTAKDNKGHYILYSYEENEKGPITVKLIHGKDSYLPGVMVFGVDPRTLVPCGCDRWEQPTELQTQMTKDRLQEEKKRDG